MSAPSGYTALDFVGFTDKGTYSPIVKYMRNDLVHYGGNIMRCLIDNTLNVTPVVGANWELWVGASANLVERVIAPLENNPADVAFGVGRQIIYDDWLWEVIAPIEVGDALIDYAVDPTNANIKKSAPVETQLLAVKAEADATDNMIAPTEASASSSSAPYSVGDQLILNNILYDVIADIQVGDALTTGTGGNIAAADTLTDQLNAKANSSDLGTAAAKDSTDSITSGSTDLVESGAVYSALTTDVWQLKDATQITATSSAHADLNTYTTPGNYSCVGDAISPYVDNQPLTSAQKSFNLIVMRQLNYNNYLKQILLYYNSQYIWVRYSINTGSTWSAWARTIVNTDSGIDLKDANGNEVNLFANSEGGNLKLSKPNNSARIEIDTNNMNGSTGYARLMLGDAMTPARKLFRLNEDGSFTDGNGNNLSTEVNKIPYFPNSGWTTLSNGVKYKKSGGLVYLLGTPGIDVHVTNGSLSIGTLPSGCRPYSLLWIPCGAELDPAILKVNTDGTVVLETARTTSFYLCLCATFPVQL